MLTDEQWTALKDLKPGDVRNAGTLRKKCGGADSVKELKREGHLEQVSPGQLRRTLRSSNAFRVYYAIPAGPGYASEDQLREEMRMLSDGPFKGRNFNAALALLEKTDEVRRHETDANRVQRARKADGDAIVRAAPNEHALYRPFISWANDQEPDEATFWRVLKTADGKGYPKGTGSWARPDVVTLSVVRHEYLPGIDVVVTSYELKLYREALKLLGAHEASAHQLRSHQSNLVVEWPDDREVNDLFPLLAECSRLGVGLYRIWGEDVVRMLDPVTRQPDPAKLSEFIGWSLQSRDIRTKYTKAIRSADDGES